MTHENKRESKVGSHTVITQTGRNMQLRATKPYLQRTTVMERSVVKITRAQLFKASLAYRARKG